MIKAKHTTTFSTTGSLCPYRIIQYMDFFACDNSPYLFPFGFPLWKLLVLAFFHVAFPEEFGFKMILCVNSGGVRSRWCADGSFFYINSIAGTCIYCLCYVSGHHANNLAFAIQKTKTPICNLEIHLQLLTAYSLLN